MKPLFKAIQFTERHAFKTVTGKDGHPESKISFWGATAGVTAMLASVAYMPIGLGVGAGMGLVAAGERLWEGRSQFPRLVDLIEGPD